VVSSLLLLEGTVKTVDDRDLSTTEVKTLWQDSVLLPPPRKLCNAQCLSVCWQLYIKTTERIFMKILL